MKEIERLAPVPEAAPDYGFDAIWTIVLPHDKQRPKDDFEERFPDESAMLFGRSRAVPVCYRSAEATDTRPNARQCPTIGSPASTESFSEV